LKIDGNIIKLTYFQRHYLEQY